MKKISRVLIIVALMGFIFFIGGIGDTLLLFNGKTVNLADPLGSFNEKALAEGEIDFVYGPFATRETTRKTYGITTSKTETDYFIVGNIESGEGFAVFSTGDTQMRSELLSLADEWYDWFTTDKDVPEPNRTISFKGKLWNMYDDDDFVTYYNEAKDDLSNIGIEANEYASMMIIDGEVSAGSYVLCFGGAALFLVSIIIAVVLFVKARQAAKREELY